MRGYLITTANAMAPEFPHLQSGPQFTKAQEGGAVRNGGKAGICYHHLPINKVLLTRKAWEGEETTRCLLALVGIKYNGCSAWTGPGGVQAQAGGPTELGQRGCQLALHLTSSEKQSLLPLKGTQASF